MALRGPPGDGEQAGIVKSLYHKRTPVETSSFRNCRIFFYGLKERIYCFRICFEIAGFVSVACKIESTVLGLFDFT